MPRSRLLAFMVPAGLVLASIARAGTIPPPPSTEVAVIRDTLHGRVLEDPYRWLEDQKSPATRAWIDAQNAYTARVMAGAPGRERIHQRLERLMMVESRTVPIAHAGRLFYTRRTVEQDQPVLCMRTSSGTEQVLVDPNPMSVDHALSVGIADVREDGKQLAYLMRSGGEDEVEMRFRDVDRGEDLPDRLPRARYFGVSLEPNGAGLF